LPVGVLRLRLYGDCGSDPREQRLRDLLGRDVVVALFDPLPDARYIHRVIRIGRGPEKVDSFSAEAPPARTVSSEEREAVPKRVLIVEDEESVRELEKFLLEQQGYEVVEARDGLEGLTKAEFRRPDLILLDLMMPDVSGGRMFDEIKAHPATAGIPIVVVTGKPNAHELFDTTLPQEDVIMKPFEADVLLARIRHHIGDPE
jgi:CheY-like chemotaxis protein